MIDPFDCVFSNDVASLSTYLEHGNVNVLDNKGLSLLDYAIRLHNNDIFKVLMRNFIDVDLQDKYGNTAYHYAVINNRLTYLKLLLTTNGNAMMPNNSGQTPLFLACLYGREEMVSLYLEHYKLNLAYKDKQEETVLMALVRSRNLKLLKQFDGYESLLEEPNYFGETPLTIAVARDSVQVASFLISKGAFINTKNHFGETPLFYAIRNENYLMVDLLLKNGALIDVKNSTSETIFDLELSDDLKAYLTEKIALYNVNNYAKLYPVHYSIIIGDSKRLANALNVSNINKADSFGYTPFYLASYYNSKEMLNILKEYSKEAKIILANNKIIS